MSRISAVLGFSFVFLALPAPAENPAETVIRDNVQKYVAAVNAGDADAAAALYTPDGTHANGFGVTLRGRREIAENLKKQLAGYARGSKLSIATLRIRFLTPSVALEEESFTLEGLTSPENQPLPPIRGFCLAVHQQLDGPWLAAAVQCFVPPPPPGR